MKNYLTRRNDSLDFFENAFDNFFKPIFYDEKFDSMKTDIKENDNGYKMEIEMAGFDKKDIEISVSDGYINISAKKDESEKDGKYLRKERSVSCQRSYYVGEIKQDDVKARYSNGILEIEVPKCETKKISSKNIEIE